ncbi:hypothetical protein H9X78_15980, partial [Clostridium saudiense]|nr:hypothetical protein [Clostridium saudiense]
VDDLLILDVRRFSEFKEIKSNSLYLNQIQESKTECKLRIDENIIFTIPQSYDEVIKRIK